MTNERGTICGPDCIRNANIDHSSTCAVNPELISLCVCLSKRVSLIDPMTIVNVRRVRMSIIRLVIPFFVLHNRCNTRFISPNPPRTTIPMHNLMNNSKRILMLKKNENEHSEKYKT